jgi:phosphoenolpyruvate synthase/pyruvate phosphate dikinase
MIAFFGDGSKNDGQRLGLKGANLCEMSRFYPSSCLLLLQDFLSLAIVRVVEVPEGFIISTAASIHYDGHIHDKMEKECVEALAQLETLTQRKFGSADGSPLLLSIRASPTKSTRG